MQVHREHVRDACRHRLRVTADAAEKAGHWRSTFGSEQFPRAKSRRPQFNRISPSGERDARDATALDARADGRINLAGALLADSCASSLILHLLPALLRDRTSGPRA